jgi:hypothetical protein
MALLQRHQEVGIRLIKDKVKLRQRSISFLSRAVTAPMVSKPDLGKCKILERCLTHLTGIHHLNGFANYLPKFLPKHSDAMEPICQLMKKDVRRNSGSPQQEAFKKVKGLAMQAPVLKYSEALFP